jgi:hypothetical protein
VPTTWRIVAGVALVAGIGEAIDSFFIGWGAIASVTFALLFFLGCWLTLRGRVAGPVIVAVMCILEIVVFAGLKRTSAWDWTSQIFFVVLSATGIVAAVAALLERRRRVAPST